MTVRNVDQNTLKNYYNNLGGLKHDLNHDGTINDYDKIDRYNEGICQPTAVSMALQYMVWREEISYIPKLDSDQLNIHNIFYEVADAYIDNNWGGAGAHRSNCYKYINTFFANNNLNYQAYYNNGINNLEYIHSAFFDDHRPCIGHIKGDDGFHAVSICGYFTAVVKYTDIYNVNQKIEINYICINDGWEDTLMPDSGGASMEQFNSNFSFIEESSLESVTYIKKIDI